ncbi:DUF3265 domain-containing protein [Vibrio cidicii]|nr:DUF3265 domain-containing protein [Vibrio cidicii]
MVSSLVVCTNVSTGVGVGQLTNCLSGIRNAWHFQYAVSFVIKAACGSFCSASLTP